MTLTAASARHLCGRAPAEEQLLRRYAAGEIGAEEYQRRLRDLRDP